MEATRVLPESYLLYRHFDDTKYKKATWVAIVLGLLVFVASFAFFNNLAGTLRPEYQPVEHLDFELTLERLTILLRLLVPVAVVLTDGRIYHHHKPESVARWKQQLRSLMEWVLARLEQSNGWFLSS